MKLPFLPNHDESSFFHFISTHHPDLTLRSHGMMPGSHTPGDHVLTTGQLSVPQATTVLALKYQAGVIIAGDRRATEGFQIADRRIEKVFKIDELSAKMDHPAKRERVRRRPRADDTEAAGEEA